MTPLAERIEKEFVAPCCGRELRRSPSFIDPSSFSLRAHYYCAHRATPELPLCGHRILEIELGGTAASEPAALPPGMIDTFLEGLRRELTERGPAMRRQGRALAVRWCPRATDTEMQDWVRFP